jgi:hypothetical protein
MTRFNPDSLNNSINGRNGSSLKDSIFSEIAELVVAHEPDALWGVPHGSQSLANQISRKVRKTHGLLIPVVNLRRIPRATDEADRPFSYWSSYDYKKTKGADRMVGIHGISSSVDEIDEALIALPDLRHKTEAIVGVWNLNPSNNTPLGVKIEWIIEG